MVDDDNLLTLKMGKFLIKQHNIIIQKMLASWKFQAIGGHNLAKLWSPGLKVKL